ncbi:MAG TPA: HAD hydrolase family protein [Chthoniobacterales bacterium]|nr:HAD hydrolase family protein [Chthoniobacterales bacterium]
MTDLRLLSLDFDGTMIAPWEGERATISQSLVDHLSLLRRHGTIIAMNTGRTLELVDKALEFFPFRPDYALTTEREIYKANGSGWEPIAEWNEECQLSHDQLYRDASDLLAEIETFLSNQTQARFHRESGRLVGVVAQDSAEMDGIISYLDSQRRHVAEFSYQRNGIYLRFCHARFDKGSVLQGLQALLEIGPAGTFAAGDNYNDLPMLRREIARYLACPVNSIAEVKAAVREGGGYVADQVGGEGLVEALFQLSAETRK